MGSLVRDRANAVYHIHLVVSYFSIIISTYNRLDLLRQALGSVWAQTFTDYELLVVDDGSTDGTWEYLVSLGQRVRAFRQPNSGPGAARNLAAQVATGKYLTFLDSDDLWFPWTLEVFHSVLCEAKEPPFVSARYCCFNASSQLAGIANGPVRWNRYLDYLAARGGTFTIGLCGVVVERGRFLSTGGFAPGRINAEDHHLWMKLGTAPGFIEILSPVTFAYRQHAGNTCSVLSKTVAGIDQMVAKEEFGEYPGGRERRRERTAVITKHARPVALACLRAGYVRDAARIFRSTFLWNVREIRVRFMICFLALLLYRVAGMIAVDQVTRNER